MTWTHIDTTKAVAGSSASPAVPTGTQAGDLLVLTAMSAGSVLTLPAGYTLIRRTLAGGAPFATAYKIAEASESAPTVTGDSTVTVILSAYRVESGTPTLDVEVGQANASSTSATTPSFTTTGVSDLLVYSAGWAGSTTITPPTGFTEPTNGDNILIGTSYALDIPAGLYGGEVGTLASAFINAAYLAAFTVATVSGGGGGRSGVRIGVGLGL